MELKRDEIIKALECCNSEGHICGKCPYESVRIGISCRDKLIRDALALITSQEQRIKELGEDNEYLKTQLTATEARYESRKESDLEEVLELRLKVEELTEENERLRCEVSVKKKLLDKCVDLEDKVKADTVRAMQERLKAQKFTHKNFGELVYVEDIDQIAKEMVEGKNES